MDVGESPIGESDVFCCAVLVPGTISMCMTPAATELLPDGKVRVKTKLLEGGNKGMGVNVPLCDRHYQMWEKDPSSFEVMIPPSDKLKNLGAR